MNPLGTRILITPRVLKVGLFGATGDITQTEFEIVRDCIEVLTFVTPSLTIEPAQNESEANFAVYIANDPDNSPDPNIFPYVVFSSLFKQLSNVVEHYEILQQVLWHERHSAIG